MDMHVQMNQATSLFYTADYEESKILFEQLLKTYSKSNNTHGTLRCYYRLACLTYTRGEMTTFAHYVEKYNALFTSFLAKDIEHYIEHNMLLGLTAISNLKYSRAIPFFASVVAQSTPKLKKQKISAMLFLQKCQMMIGNIEQAEMIDAELNSYIEFMENDTQQILHLYLNRAYLAMVTGNEEKFTNYIELAKNHVYYHFSVKEPIFVAVLQSKKEAASGNYVEAIKTLQNAFNATEQVEDAQILYMAYSALIEYYEETQNHKNALHYAKLLMALERNRADYTVS